MLRESAISEAHERRMAYCPLPPGQLTALRKTTCRGVTDLSAAVTGHIGGFERTRIKELERGRRRTGVEHVVAVAHSGCRAETTGRRRTGSIRWT